MSSFDETVHLVIRLTLKLVNSRGPNVTSKMKQLQWLGLRYKGYVWILHLSLVSAMSLKGLEGPRRALSGPTAHACGTNTVMPVVEGAPSLTRQTHHSTAWDHRLLRQQPPTPSPSAGEALSQGLRPISQLPARPTTSEGWGSWFYC